MDITNYTWISIFDPNKAVQTPSPSNSSQQPSSSSSSQQPSSSTSSQQPSSNSQQYQNNDDKSYKTVIIFASLFGISGGVIILVCGFFIFRWIHKKRQVSGLHDTTDD